MISPSKTEVARQRVPCVKCGAREQEPCIVLGKRHPLVGRAMLDVHNERLRLFNSLYREETTQRGTRVFSLKRETPTQTEPIYIEFARTRYCPAHRAISESDRYVIVNGTGFWKTGSLVVYDKVMQIEVFHWYGDTADAKTRAVAEALNALGHEKD